MNPVEVRHHLDPGELTAVQELLDDVAAVDGQPGLDEGGRAALDQGETGFVALIAPSEGGAGRPHPAGYAQLHHGPEGWDLAVVTHPRHRDARATVARALAHAAADVIRQGGGGTVRMVASQPRPEHDRVAAELGLAGDRALYQMRRPLPLPDALAGEGQKLATRPFRPGADDDAWLTVNNRAFADHPDQGGWDRATLAVRVAEPWFDPAGFLLHDEDGVLAGFCWTKVHAQARPPLAEIYVIAVDPDFAGRGLGRQLVLAGLDYLAGYGRGVVGMLYTEANNVAAVKLYADLGFQVDHIDRVYSGEL
jgi:mycothiol synthase